MGENANIKKKQKAISFTKYFFWPEENKHPLCNTKVLKVSFIYSNSTILTQVQNSTYLIRKRLVSGKIINLHRRVSSSYTRNMNN